MSSAWLTHWSNYSFRKQLFLILTTFSAVITITIISFFIANERKTQKQRLLHEGQLLASVLTRDLQLPLYAGYNEEVAKITTAMLDYNSITAIKVRDEKGHLVADLLSATTRQEAKPLRVTAEVIASSSFAPEEQLFGDTLAPGKLIGTVELTLNSLTIAAQMQNFIKTTALIGLSIWLLTCAIGFLILRQITGTISLLLAGIDKIAKGDLSSKIELTSSADTAQAAATINNLAATLQQREAENHQLQLEKVNSLRLELDEEKTRHMAKLIQTNRMTSLGLLVSSMAHEINNPNGAIRLAGEYLSTAWRDAEKLLKAMAATEGDFSIGGLPFSSAGEEIFKATDTISRCSGRIERVVQNLRSYSLGDRSELSHDVDLNRVTRSALTIVRAHSRVSDVNIDLHLDQQLPVISGNPFQLEQVMTNLLLNAIQAMPPKGSRRIFLTTAWQQHDNTITIEVRDEGHGIPLEHLPHLCEPFFSTRIDVGGSGLGLYITNFIVTEHQGWLEFDSRPGTGSTVTVHLPINRATTPLAEA